MTISEGRQVMNGLVAVQRLNILHGLIIFIVSVAAIVIAAPAARRVNSCSVDVVTPPTIFPGGYEHPLSARTRARTERLGRSTKNWHGGKMSTCPEEAPRALYGAQDTNSPLGLCSPLLLVDLACCSETQRVRPLGGVN